MLDILQTLAKSTDVVIILGAPNIRYTLRIDLDSDAVVAYRGTTNECRILVPIDAKEYVRQYIPSKCILIAYSYSVVPTQDYVIGRSFGEIVLGFLKSFVKPYEEVGVPFAYITAPLFLVLSKYWKPKDITRELRIIRSRKTSEDLDTIIKMHTTVKKTVNEICVDGYQVAIDKCFKELTNVVSGIYIELMHISKGFASLYMRFKKGILRFSYRWSVPLEKNVEKLVNSVNNAVERSAKDIMIGSRCLDVVRLVRSYSQAYGIEGIEIDVCGIGTEECEYPSIPECIYEDTIMENNMVMKIEMAISKAVYIPKLFVIKDNMVEVY